MSFAAVCMSVVSVESTQLFVSWHIFPTVSPPPPYSPLLAYEQAGLPHFEKARRHSWNI